MHERQAKELLEARVQAGGTLVVAQEAELPVIKQLQIKCHEAGVPTMLGPCDKDG